MNKVGITSLSLLGIMIACIVFNSCGGKATGADGTVVAEFEWDGKFQITLEEMMQEIGELPEYKQRQYKDKEGLAEYMQLMAESRLILCLAKDRKIDEDPAIMKKVQDYLHEIMVEKITDIEIEQKLKLTEEDYRLYYEEHKDDYIQPEQIRLTCITLKDKERLAEVFAEIQDGRDIAELAQELSDRGELTGPGANPEKPGDTGLFSRDSYSGTVEVFANVAFDLEVGQIVDEIVEISYREEPYYMVFRKEEHTQKRQKEFDEADVQRSVKRAMERQKREDLMNTWVTQLRDQAKVKVHADRLPEPPKEPEPPEEEESEEDK